MLTTIATVLAGLIGAGCVFIGVNALRSPRSAAGYGIPGTPTESRNWQAWLSAKAARDIGSGVFILILVAGATPHLLGWFMLAAAGIPAADAVIVARSGGPKAVAYGVHAATAAVMVVISVLLLVG